MKKTIAIFALLGLLTLITLVTRGRASDSQANVDVQNPNGLTNHQKVSKKQSTIDIAIALDVSGSMSGLINAARHNLWTIVNEVAQAKPSPKLRVALITLGNSDARENDHVKVLSGLTSDLDSISEILFSLRTSGSNEYVYKAIDDATTQLAWSKDPKALKQIYVAGNESISQGGISRLNASLNKAQEERIFVNTIYCGGTGDGDAYAWKQAAEKAKGMFAAIDHNHGTVVVNSPYDERLRKLSEKLNRTYIGYGAKGRIGMQKQAAQDRLASSVAPSLSAKRAVAKASKVYRNSNWDLVDRKNEGSLASVDKEDLPANLRKMSKDELNGFLETKRKEREEIKEEIRKLAKKRSAFVKEESKRKGYDKKRSFGKALRKSIKRQAKAMNINM